MFEINKKITNKPAYRPRPKQIVGYHWFSNGCFDAFVHKENVLRTISQWALESRNSEIVGRLVGRPYRDEHGEWVILTDAISAHFVGGPITVKTTVEDGAVMARALEQEHPTEELMGWYHSHTCELDEYSSTDKINQAEWSKPYHMGLLVTLHGDSVTVHAYCSPESKRMHPSVTFHNSSLSKVHKSEQLSSVALPEPSVMPVTAYSTTTQNAPTSRGRIWDLAHLAIWPAVFLIGIHLVADAVSQIQIPVVIHETDERKFYEDRLSQTEETIGKLGHELHEQTSQIQLQLERIQAYQERNQNGIGLLNWIAGYITALQTDPSTKSATEGGKSH